MGIRSVGDLRRDQQCVRDAVIRIGSSAATWSAVSRAITSIQCVPDCLRARMRNSGSRDQNVRLQNLIKQTEGAVSLLHDGGKSGERLFFSYSLVAHWSYFEAFCDDYVDARLASVTGLIEALELDLGVPKRNGWSHKILWDKLRGKYGEGNFSVRLQRMLSAVNVEDFDLSEEQSGVLNFSNAARNCLLHSSGLWDEKGCRDAGFDKGMIGSRVDIGMQDFLACYDVVSYILRKCQSG